MKLDKIIYMTV